MFRFSELKNIHLEITNRCQASCPMCSRNIHGGLENPLILNKDWTTKDFMQILTKQVLKQLEGFYFCGNFGDPIINNDLLDMCKYSKEINPNLYIRIHTNGSARNEQWWTNLAESLPSAHNVIFAIDGLEDTHSVYRIGTSYDIILRNAKAFIKAGGTAEWAFIKFKHNEHQLEDAKNLASDLGFARFTYKDSSRFVGTEKFKVVNKEGETVYYLEPPTGSDIKYITQEVIDNYKDIVQLSEIDCYVKQTKEIYIDAYKKVMPCCFLASIPYNFTKENDITKNVRLEIQEQYQNLIKDLGNTNALDKSIIDIIESDQWQNVWKKYWHKEKLITCARTCGKNKLSKPKDQFIEKVTLE